jgi:hypothetical protein
MDYTIKRLPDYSDESLLNELRRVAKLLNKDTLTEREFAQHGRASYSSITRRFGWNNALKKAGLIIHRATNISDEELFAEIERVWNQLGRQPQYKEINQLGKFSTKPYENRFGSWVKALEAFAQCKGAGRPDRVGDLKEISPEILIDQPQKPRKIKKVEYGEPIDFLGLRHASLNEQGVVYLFGILSRQLGFIIEAVRTDFPDCEGKRKIPGKQERWERVSIEFEYRSSHFREHGHNPNDCDVIVCWKHDWKDCPIEAISLKKIYEKIRRRELEVTN